MPSRPVPCPAAVTQQGVRLFLITTLVESIPDKQLIVEPRGEAETADLKASLSRSLKV